MGQSNGTIGVEKTTPLPRHVQKDHGNKGDHAKKDLKQNNVRSSPHLIQCQPAKQTDDDQRKPTSSFCDNTIDNRPTSVSNVVPEITFTRYEDVSLEQNISDRMPNEQTTFQETNDNAVEESESSKRDKTRPKKDKKEKKKKKKEQKKLKGNSKHSEEEQNKKNKDRSTHDSELTNIKEENEALKQEIDNLTTRLSAVASAKLTDGNPNIADLSDENRPTKLAEQYSELYDNEWTDAFDVMSKNEVPDEQVCRILLEIFCLVYETCLRKANDELHNVVDGIKAFIGCQEPPIEVMKSLKDKRKRHFKEQCKQIKMFQGLSDGIKQILQTTSVCEDKKIEAFVNNSIELSWLMVVQDPPVFVDTYIERCGELYFSNEMKAYTKSGIYIDFIVWPSLYLQKGGNMLCKGIAQCKADANRSDTRLQNAPEETTGDKTDKDEIQLRNKRKNVLVANIASNLTKDIELPSTAHNLIETDETSSFSSTGDNGKDAQSLKSKGKKKSFLKKMSYSSGKIKKKSVSDHIDQENSTGTATSHERDNNLNVQSHQTETFKSENKLQHFSLSSPTESSFSDSSTPNVPQNDADIINLRSEGEKATFAESRKRRFSDRGSLKDKDVNKSDVD